MAESDQTFVGNNEQQDFTVQESDQHHLSTNEFDHQNFDGNVHGEFNYVGTETENQLFAENEPTFAGNDPSSNYGVVSNEMYPQNETEHAFEGDQGNGLTEDGSKQELTGNEANETNNVSDNSHPEEKAGHGNNQTGGSEKKWPGWPGESVFRMLVPAQKVGNIMGRKGEYIKKTVEETKARIKVLDGPPGSQERAVLVSAKEIPDAALPPAINGILSIHRRIVEGLNGDSSQAPPTGVKVSTKLLVPATQAGSLIGKQGATVKSIQEAAGCMVRVLGQEDLPVFALQDDRVVEIAGEPTNVHTALELVASHLRKFLVDRSIIPIFEKQMQAPSTPMEHIPPPQPWGHPHPHGLPPNTGAGRGYGPPQYMPPPPHQLESYYPPVEMPPPAERQPHQGISAYGREPQMNVHASATAQPAQSMITQVTQHMQIPLLYADAVIGTNGATISYIRRASGATVTIQESRGAPGDMTVEINGTASQVQAAQQLIQNFMADAGAPPAAQTQAAATTEQAYSQGYNTYAAAAAPPATMYGAPATSTAQPATYGSVYGTGYGY